MTSQREIVLEILHHTTRPVSAQMVLKAARSSDTSMNLTTVYRTLDLFERFGLLVSYESGHDSRRYILTAGDAHLPRLICSACGAMTSLETSNLENCVGRSRSSMGWKVNLNTAVLTGLCPVCAEQTRS